ncbi:TIGR03960 family B12-binding radical SAM protein [Pseudoflavonifractor phocaeensis]|uniref:TIGR03960 family B12-binding radical SAM protein n=1 Tax=Pseudoflavonifractor phocaeensis TaxID=1870988 RepID=UPI001F1A27FB|nr:TIGR03960 family B12-binding radical SAM protein [Pseudoflavonifractor phocaeensis]MCF2660977.1 TIGR03960 family B12-binding radical SAM protein [Pseudoflavonifractor phocaeensis]
MNRTLEHILPKVQKPARYTGGEYNAVVKDKQSVDVRFALCFPDTYEIGMSNLGCRILYGLMNEQDHIWCERCFAPWGDMEEEMRREGLLLYGLESGDPIADFDFIGFSLGYEMAYSNVLNMLDLAEVPLRSADRPDLTPLVVAGGTCCYNPEPLAPFIDFFSLGEGEEVTLEYIDLYRQAKEEGWSKEEYLREVAKIPGIYVPSLYDVTYHEDGTVAAITPKDGAPATVTKRIVQDMDKSYFPVKTIIPSTEIVHDRVMLELFRGCIRGCRFCQAGYAYRPVRNRDPKLLAQYGKAACEDSGYQEMTLSSLSSTDYPCLMELCDDLLDYCAARDIGLSLPSLRADTFSMSLMERLQRVRKGGLTFAPEAGTQRLRDAINKNLREEDLLQSVRTAFSGGWSGVKLYFMLGLPTETDEDVLGIADLARKVYFAWRECTPNKARGVRITVSTSWFVPKPHTAFQWEAQIPVEEYQRRVDLLRDAFKRDKSITYNWHDPQTSYLEAIFSRGDRRLADVLEWAWAHGAKMDSWSEYFDYQRWMDALAACGLSGDFYAHRVREKDEVFPWSVPSVGVSREFLWHERELCYQSQTTPDCRTRCSGCGANKLLTGGGRCG